MVDWSRVQAGRVSLPEINIGCDWKSERNLLNPDMTPVDMTLMTARMDFRRDINDATAAIRLSTENGRILLTDPDYNLIFQLTDTETKTLTDGKYLADLIFTTSTGFDVLLFRGSLTARKVVTRD